MPIQRHPKISEDRQLPQLRLEYSIRVVPERVKIKYWQFLFRSCSDADEQMILFWIDPKRLTLSLELYRHTRLYPLIWKERYLFYNFTNTARFVRQTSATNLCSVVINFSLFIPAWRHAYFGKLRHPEQTIYRQTVLKVKNTYNLIKQLIMNWKFERRIKWLNKCVLIHWCLNPSLYISLYNSLQRRHHLAVVTIRVT